MILSLDMNNDNIIDTGCLLTKMESSAYTRSINYVYGGIKIKCKNISEDPNRTTFKSYIHNIQTILNKNDIYKNSSKKNLIENNIDDLVCSYGISEEEAKNNLEDRIKFNTKLYNESIKNGETVSGMNKIFFDIILDLDARLFKI